MRVLLSSAVDTTLRSAYGSTYSESVISTCGPCSAIRPQPTHLRDGFGFIVAVIHSFAVPSLGIKIDATPG